MKKVLFLFGVLEHEDIEWLIEEGEQLLIPANHHLIDKGKDIDQMYVVLDGELGIYDLTTSKKPFSIIGQGEILGELSFIDRLPPSATVISNEASELLSISKQAIEKKLKKDKAFASRFYYSLSLLLSHRLRNRTNELGEGDVLGEFLMDNLHQAGSSFRQVVDEIRGRANN